MKIALYVEDGRTQIVLTPQTPAEKAVLDNVKPGAELSVKRGSFYECRGGWVRQSQNDESTMLVLRPETVFPEEAA
jgi:hypothetical protein